MADEIKVRVRDWRRVEAELLARGAVFREERNIVDTYFNQPEPHHVLKIQKDDRAHWYVKLTPHDGKFAIDLFERIDGDPAPLYAQLTEKFGVMSVLTKRCRFYDWRDYVIDFNLIDGYGDFLVLTGTAPSAALLRELGIDEPEFVTVM